MKFSWGSKTIVDYFEEISLFFQVARGGGEFVTGLSKFSTAFDLVDISMKKEVKIIFVTVFIDVTKAFMYGFIVTPIAM